MSKYIVDAVQHSSIPHHKGEFSPSYAPEFARTHRNSTILIAVSDSPYSSKFQPEEWYAVPGDVFQQFFTDGEFSLPLPGDKYVQFFYLEEGQKFEPIRTQERREKPRLEIRKTIHDRSFILYWNTYNEDYTLDIINKDNSFSSDVSGLLDIRLTDDEETAQKMFSTICGELEKKPGITIQEITDVVYEVREQPQFLTPAA